MRQWLFRLAAVLWVLLFVAAAALWVRSTRVYDCVYYRGDVSFFQVHQAHGVLMVGLGEKCHKESFGWDHGEHALRRPEIYRWARRWRGGFSVHFEKMTSNCYGQNVWCVATPHWFVVSLLAAPVGWWAATRVRSALRNRAGRCGACGYDLRATPDRCPECGTVIAAS